MINVSQKSMQPSLGNCGKKLSNKLLKLQNRAARVKNSSNYDVDVESSVTL